MNDVPEREQPEILDNTMLMESGNIVMDTGKNLRREKNVPWPNEPFIPTKINGWG